MVAKPEQCLDLDLNRRRAAARRQTGTKPLQRRPDLNDLACLFGRKLSDIGPVARAEIHQSLGFQHPQRLAHGVPGDPQ